MVKVEDKGSHSDTRLTPWQWGKPHHFGEFADVGHKIQNHHFSLPVG